MDVARRVSAGARASNEVEHDFDHEHELMSGGRTRLACRLRRLAATIFFPYAQKYLEKFAMARAPSLPQPRDEGAAPGQQ